MGFIAIVVAMGFAGLAFAFMPYVTAPSQPLVILEVAAFYNIFVQFGLTLLVIGLFFIESRKIKHKKYE